MRFQMRCIVRSLVVYLIVLKLSYYSYSLSAQRYMIQRHGILLQFFCLHPFAIVLKALKRAPPPCVNNLQRISYVIRISYSTLYCYISSIAFGVDCCHFEVSLRAGRALAT